MFYGLILIDRLNGILVQMVDNFKEMVTSLSTYI